MKKVLGLDLGVSSIGWAYIETDKNSLKGRILDAGVRIIPLDTKDADEFSKGNSVSPSKDRRMKRGMRRNLQRFKLRRKRLLTNLIHLGWWKEGQLWQSDDPIEIYGLRARAVKERLEPEELARVFLALNAKRGFQSNRKAQNDDEDSTDYLDKIRERDRELVERGITIGQKHLELLQSNRWTTLKRRTYSRKSYRHEFDQIWEFQKTWHPELTHELYREIADRTIFYQRPLRTQKGLISKCTLEPTKRVAPKSSPVFQEFKIWQQLHNLRLKDDTGREFWPTQEQKQVLFTRLNDEGKLTTSAFKKELKIGAKEPVHLNFEKLEGNYTRSALLKVFENTGYDTHEILDIDYTLEGNEFDKQPAMMLWHLLYATPEQDVLIAKLKEKFSFNEQQALAVAKVKLIQNYGNLSVRAIRRILPWMQDGLSYDKACEKAGYRHSNHETRSEREHRELADQLEIIKKGSLRNPVVEKILNQLIHLVNDILAHPDLGRPDEIRIELARDLKNNAKKRKEITSRIARETDENNKLYKILTEEFGLNQVSRKDIQKLKLFKEQGGVSIYTGNPISKSKLFTTDEYDIDHIIPQSRIFDDSMMNKALCESHVNREKGNLTAWDYLHTKGEQAVRNYLQRIEGNKEISLSKKVRLRMPLHEIPDDFINRQLKESQYIVRESLSRMKAICREVTSTTGTVTGFLRNEWGLAHLMQELNRERYEALGRWGWKEEKSGRKVPKIDDWTKREDHRHHAVDALVVACTSQGIIQQLNTLNATYENFRQAGEKRLKFPEPWAGFHRDAAIAISSILISFKSSNKVATWNKNRIKTKSNQHETVQRTLTPRGQLHLETVYGQIRQRSPHPTPLNNKFDRPDLIINPELRRIVKERWHKYDNDSLAAAASLKKDPLMWNGEPLTEVNCWMEQYSIRKPIDPNLNLEKIIDPVVHEILQERLYAYNGDKKKAFSDLDNNPIWFNKDKGIAIRNVRIYDNGNLLPLHHNRDRPIDYVYSKNNHHAAIYQGPNGEKALEMVSFFEAVERKRLGFPVIAPNNVKGWPLAFTLQINDYWLFDVDMEDMHNFDVANRESVSKNLFRIQTLSTTASNGPDFRFRHHLETTLKNENEYSFRRVKSFSKLTGQKVFVNRLGHLIKSR